MKAIFQRTSRFLDLTLNPGPRVLLLGAALMLLPTYFLPLWKMTMYAPQYPAGLRLEIYSYKLEGANNGQDVREVNVLNHYIGMKDLSTAEFTEFKWIPFVIGMLGLLFLRALVQGKMKDLVDVSVLYVYFGLFSLWSFGYKLYLYGHNLSPQAAVTVEPFMPPLFGHREIANFHIYSYPGSGSYALTAVVALLLGAFVLGWRQERRADALDAQTAG